MDYQPDREAKNNLLVLPITDGSEEFKTSLLIHTALLLFLSALFIWRHAGAVKLPQVYSVRLIGPSFDVKPGSGIAALRNPASSLKSGSARVVSKGGRDTRKRSSSPRGKPVNNQKQTSSDSKTHSTSEKSISLKRVESRNNPRITNIAQTTPSLSGPANVQLNKPTFDEISAFSNEPSDSQAITPPISADDLGEPIDMPIPAADEQSAQQRGTGDQNSAPSGLPESGAEPGGGEIDIEGIESIAGGAERFEPPKIITKVLPDYPEWARKKGISGQAIYKVLVQPAGTVGDVLTLASTIDPKLAIIGSQALRRWVFSPVLVGGEPCETWVKISVHFNLN